MRAQAAPSLEHSIWLKDFDLAFIYMPKVACTTWKIYFSRALGLKIPGNYAEVHSGQHLPLPYVSGMDNDHQRIFTRGLRENKIEAVSIVRDPRERILSAYTDKIYCHRNPSSYFSLQVIPSLQEYARKRASSELSFELFLEWLTKSTSPHTQNDHWLPMSSILGLSEDGKQPSSWKLWPMTEMHQALQYLNQRLGVSLELPSNQELGCRKSTESRLKVASAFSDDAEHYFRILYKQDIQLYSHVKSIHF